MARSVFMKILAPAMLAALNAFAAEEPAGSTTAIPDPGPAERGNQAGRLRLRGVDAAGSHRPRDGARVRQWCGAVRVRGRHRASSSVISPRVVARLKLVPDPARAKLLRGITGSEVVSTVAVESITAGEIMLPKSELPVVEPRVFADADGIFGADAFARGCLYVNFASAHVSILRTACPRVGENWEVMRARLRFGGLAVVNARVGNTSRDRHHRHRRGALARQSRVAGRVRPAGAGGRSESRKQVFAATSQAVFGNLVATPSIRLGGVEIGNLQVVFGDFEVFRMWEWAISPPSCLAWTSSARRRR